MLTKDKFSKFLKKFVYVRFFDDYYNCTRNKYGVVFDISPDFLFVHNGKYGLPIKKENIEEIKVVREGKNG